MSKREALYAALGLVDAQPDPNATCGGCDACSGRMPPRPDYFTAAQEQSKERLQAIAQEREERMANVRLIASRSRIGRNQGTAEVVRFQAFKQAR